jgi:hypothetical protein
MKKYRIVKKHYINNIEYFIVQEKNILGIWTKPSNVLLLQLTGYHLRCREFRSLQDAKEALDMAVNHKADEVVYETST